MVAGIKEQEVYDFGGLAIVKRVPRPVGSSKRCRNCTHQRAFHDGRLTFWIPGTPAVDRHKGHCTWEEHIVHSPEDEHGNEIPELIWYTEKKECRCEAFVDVQQR